MDCQPEKFLKVYLEIVGEKLGRDVDEMNAKVEGVQRYILKNEAERDQMTGVLNDLTRTYVRKFDVVYYSIKEMLRTLLEDEEFPE